MLSMAPKINDLERPKRTFALKNRFTEPARKI